MNLKRIIPIILIEDSGAYITNNFKKRKYIGDPINITKIFSNKAVHEIFIVCPKGWRNEKSTLLKLARQARVPLSISGKILGGNDIEELLTIGYEKVVISPKIDLKSMNKIISKFGTSTVSCKLDVKLSGLLRKRFKVDGQDLKIALSKLERFEFNELIFIDIDRDGSRGGYNNDLIENIVESKQFYSGDMNIGYGGGINDWNSIKGILQKGFSSVYSGTHFSTTKSNNGVLINYPNEQQLNQIK